MFDEGQRSHFILEKAQRPVTNERITRINQQLDYYKKLRAHIDEHLFTNLPGNHYDETKRWMAQAHDTKFYNIRSGQQQKFERLLQNRKWTNKEDYTIIHFQEQDKKRIQDKFVVSLSSRTPTEDETSLLKKGLNFAITPNTIPINDYIIGIE